MNTHHKKALVLLSGGQDSTTCLVWAKNHFKEVHAIAFDYGQRHRVELESAQKIAELTGVPLTIHLTSLFTELTENALTTHTQEITAQTHDSLPSTFVPGRNMIFLAIAGIHASTHDIRDLVTGVCQTDYSGYPDCRSDFVTSMEHTLSLALDHPMRIHAPLMWLTKAETVKLMADLDHLELLSHSHTCYKGERPACGTCPACTLRLKGFKEAGITDPLSYAS